MLIFETFCLTEKYMKLAYQKTPKQNNKPENKTPTTKKKEQQNKTYEKSI